MKFLSPLLLLLLLAAPALVALYFYLLARKKKMAVRYADIGRIREALGPGATWRRHIPAMLLLVSIVLALTAVAKPAAMVTLPSQRALVILAMDVSGSMRARDVEPNRLTAAQNAAKQFITQQPSTTRIGIVAFAGAAALVQTPTLNRDELTQAIDRFRTFRGTAIGSGILVSLQTIFPDAAFDPRFSESDFGRDRDRQGASLDQPAQPAFKPVPPGSNQNSTIILLTDGRATVGPDPIETARMAADRGVRIYTVGLGSANGGGYYGGMQFDEESLKTIADVTKGKYFAANSGAALNEVYKSLNTQLVMERQETEISSIFAAVAAVFAIAAAAMSLIRQSRIL
ncbi:MAG: VWA domain-containing protein [Rhodospirillaceae bacterium]|nr:VWA domain-containing protein [Rhodospirillaceae bacterium]